MQTRKSYERVFTHRHPTTIENRVLSAPIFVLCAGKKDRLKERGERTDNNQGETANKKNDIPSFGQLSFRPTPFLYYAKGMDRVIPMIEHAAKAKSSLFSDSYDIPYTFMKVAGE